MPSAGITLVLSGGGAKTAAHIGAARAVEEAGWTPVRYVATSMGAVVAAALAGGADREVLLGRLAQVGRAGVSRDLIAPVLGLFARSLLRAAPFRRAVEQIVSARRFAELGVTSESLDAPRQVEAVPRSPAAPELTALDGVPSALDDLLVQQGADDPARRAEGA